MEKKWWPSLSVLTSSGVRPMHLAAPLFFTALILLMLWFPSNRTSALPPDLDAPFPIPLYLMHVVGQVFGGVEYPYDLYFAYTEQPTAGWVLVPDGSGGYIQTHIEGSVSGPHATPRQACQALPAGVTSFMTIFVVYDCAAPPPTQTYTPTPTRTPRPTATATLEAPPLTAKVTSGEIVVCSTTVQGSKLQHPDSPSECRTLIEGQEVEFNEGDLFNQLLNSKISNSGFRVSADCKEKTGLLLELYFTGKNVTLEELSKVAVLVQNLAIIFEIACANDAMTSAQSHFSSLDDPLVFGLEQGQIETTLLEKAFSLGLETKTATISAANLSHFRIGYDPITKATEITSLGGTVSVTPVNTSLAAFTLDPFQKVTVSPTGVGNIVDVPSVYLPALQR